MKVSAHSKLIKPALPDLVDFWIALIKQDGVTVWSCPHKHISGIAAKLCANNELFRRHEAEKERAFMTSGEVGPIESNRFEQIFNSFKKADSPSEAALRAVAESTYFAALKGGCSEASALEAQEQAVSDYIEAYHKNQMNICADDARIACPLFHAEYGGSRPTSALQLVFSTVPESVFKALNSEWHSRLPKIGNSHFRVCFKAECNNIIYAVAAWSNPVARLLPQQTWMELRRFAIAEDAPRFTASRMLGWMARSIWIRFSEVERLISYQDLSAHTGTIYKASGWKQAENFKPRARGCIGWGNRPRQGRTNQSVAPRMRWEKHRTPELRSLETRL